MSDLPNRIVLDRIPHIKEQYAPGAEDPITFAHCRFLVGNKHQAKLANDRATNGVPPIVVKINNRPVESFVVRTNAQLVTADFAKVLKWNVARAQRRHRLFEIFRRDGYDDP